MICLWKCITNFSNYNYHKIILKKCHYHLRSQAYERIETK